MVPPGEKALFYKALKSPPLGTTLIPASFVFKGLA